MDFADTKIFVKGWCKEICPWKAWSYKVKTDINGVQKVLSHKVPTWWTLYNRVKHQRTTTVTSYNNIPFYKHANQKNVINALGALYILEIACINLIKEREEKLCGKKIEYTYEKSALFSLNSETESTFYQKYTII